MFTSSADRSPSWCQKCGQRAADQAKWGAIHAEIRRPAGWNLA
jgi:hypothetical protein